MEGHKGYMRKQQVRGGEVKDPLVKGEVSQVAHTRYDVRRTAI
jgi:hypothetical protein